MLQKAKRAITSPTGKRRVVATVLTMILAFTFVCPCLFAAAGGAALDTGAAGDIVGSLIEVVLTIFRYIGVLLLVWAVGMLVLAFKNEDADSKSRAMMLLVVSAILISLKTFVNEFNLTSYL